MTIVSPTMRERIAAQSVIEELIQHQNSVSPRSTFARVFGMSPLGEDSEPWYQGAQGELAVGAILARLPEGWTVFHALPVGTKDSDIDHVVVGPGGVFTINTKRHKDKKIWVGKRAFMVNGQKLPHLRNSEFEADRVTKLIQARMPQLAPAQSVIALVDPKQITMRERPERVKVIDARHLRRWLMKRPTILHGADLERLVALIDDPSTWRALEPADPTSLIAEFNIIDAEVRSARARRRLWIATLCAGLFVTAVLAYPALVAVFQDITVSLLG